MALWNILLLKDSFINLADEVRYDPLSTSPLVQWSRFYFKQENMQINTKWSLSFMTSIKVV